MINLNVNPPPHCVVILQRTKPFIISLCITCYNILPRNGYEHNNYFSYNKLINRLENHMVNTCNKSKHPCNLKVQTNLIKTPAYRLIFKDGMQ